MGKHVAQVCTAFVYDEFQPYEMECTDRNEGKHIHFLFSPSMLAILVATTPPCVPV